MKIKQKVCYYTNTSMEANIPNICEFFKRSVLLKFLNILENGYTKGNNFRVSWFTITPLTWPNEEQN
jgi:hypothetical protein